MNGLCYLDANFVIALLIKNHSQSKKALAKSLEIREMSFAISYLLVDELLYGMTKYSQDRAFIYKAIKQFLNSGNFVVVGPGQSNFSIEDYLRTWKSSSLKPRDAMHLQIMRSNNIKYMVTFDGDFISRQKELGITVV